MYLAQTDPNSSEVLKNYNSSIPLEISTQLLVYPRTNYTLNFAFGNGSVSYHGDNLTYGFITLFENKTVVIETYPNVTPPDTFFIIVGAVLSVCWILANFFGVYAAAYMKYHINWIYFHVILSGGSGLLTIILGFIGLSLSIIKSNH